MCNTLPENNETIRVLETSLGDADRIAFALHYQRPGSIPRLVGIDPVVFMEKFIKMVGVGEITCDREGSCQFHCGKWRAPSDIQSAISHTHSVIQGYGSINTQTLRVELGLTLEEFGEHIGRLLRWGWIRYEAGEYGPNNGTIHIATE